MIPGTVSVAFLHPGHYSAVFAESLEAVLFADIQSGRILSHRFGKLGKQCGSAGIVDGRNAVARAFLDEADSEWLFMVDSDMGFAADTVERLVAAADAKERPIVGALAFAQKTAGSTSLGGIRYVAQPTIYQFLEFDDRAGFAPWIDYPKDELVQVGATGAACLLVHRSVFETIRAKYGDRWFDPVSHPKSVNHFSEDLSFCVRVAGCDFPMYVHTGVKTTHDKGFTFLDEEFYDAQQAGPFAIRP